MWIGIQLKRCLRISLFNRVVLSIIFTLQSSYGIVLNTTVGILEIIVRLTAFAKLILISPAVNVIISSFVSILEILIRDIIIYCSIIFNIVFVLINFILYGI